MGLSDKFRKKKRGTASRQAVYSNEAKEWFNKGVELAGLLKHQEAIKCFDKAIKIDPNHADAWYWKGLALRSIGKYDEAIKCFDKDLLRDLHN